MSLKILCVTVCLVSLWSLSSVGAIEVCSNFWDYSWAYCSKNCYNDPTVNLNITEIIKSWKFTAEEHYLTTDDGYKILLERAHSTITNETPIVIVHGIVMNAVEFVNRGEKSLAYILGNLGYDVWLLNYRGTRYSREHVKMTTNDNEYWKFSINELGIYDIRTTLKHVNKITKQKPIYIGYSMGTTGFFIYSTTFPEESQQLVKAVIGLAPIINYKDIKSAIKYLSPIIWPTVKPMIYRIFHGEVIPGFPTVLRPLMSCTAGIYIVQYFINQLFGDDYDQMDPLTYPQFILQLDTTGAEIITHYLQMHEAGVFQNYDHGYDKNLDIYGSEKPPAYDLSKINVPLALFVGKNDWLATQTNAEQLYNEIQPSIRCGYQLIDFDKWSHTDFLAAKDIVHYLYRHLIVKIEDMDSGKCTA